MIIIPMKNGYFIGNINPTFSDTPKSFLGIVDTVAQWLQNSDDPKKGRRDLDQMPLQDVIFFHVPFIVYRCATVLSVLG